MRVIVMPMNTFRTAQDLEHLSKDLEKIMRENIAEPGRAAMTYDAGKVRPMGREKSKSIVFSSTA